MSIHKGMQMISPNSHSACDLEDNFFWKNQHTLKLDLKGNNTWMLEIWSIPRKPSQFKDPTVAFSLKCIGSKFF